VIVFSHDVKQHLVDVNQVLALLQAAGVTLKLKKCHFFQPKVDYLGFVITPGKLHVATDNAKAFSSALFPRDKTQLRSFLGAANVYRRFVAGYSGIARPLNGMLKKGVEPDWQHPSSDQLAAFEQLKRQLTSPPILALPQQGRPYMIDTDASAYQLGAVLLQQQDDDRPNDWQPVGYWSYTLNAAERNYSATERECYSVVWAVTSLRPYIEGQHFTVRTDHEALRWLMTLTNSSGRLLRWRLRLSEFDFSITYRPGRVHQVPDALSRLLTPDGEERPVDDDIPAFGDHTAVLAVETRGAARRAANPSPPPVTTRADEGVAQGRATDVDADATVDNKDDAGEDVGSAADDPSPSVEDPVVNDDEALDDVLDEEPDIFDAALAYEDDGRDVQPANVPMPLSRRELLDGQRHDAFCQTVLARQSKSRDSAFYEGPDGLLRRRNPHAAGAAQIVLPESLRPRLLDMVHRHQLAGHPGQTRMYYAVRRTYYWPHMAADIYATVRNCAACARNRLKLRKRTNPLRLFPAKAPLEDLCIDILGPLVKTKGGNRFLLVVTDRFSKLTSVTPLARISADDVARAFVGDWVFKYGPPKTLISDNGKQFASKFFQRICSILGVSNIFTSTYHPQTNGQVERYNRTVLAMLRNYVNEHQSDWDRYAYALTYAYNCHVHSSTGTTPFDLVLSRPPPPFSLDRAVETGDPQAKADRRNAFARGLDDAMQSAYTRLKRTQARYKRNFDSRVRRAPGGLRLRRPKRWDDEGHETGQPRAGPISCAEE